MGMNKLAGISDEDIQWANDFAKEKYAGADMGQQDAARHMALGWLASQSERDPEAPSPNALLLIQGREIVDFKPLSAGMDRHNNKVGYNMGLLASDKDQAAEMIFMHLDGTEGIGLDDELPEQSRAVFYKSDEAKKIKY